MERTEKYAYILSFVVLLLMGIAMAAILHVITEERARTVEVTVVDTVAVVRMVPVPVPARPTGPTGCSIELFEAGYSLFCREGWAPFFSFNEGYGPAR